MHLVLFTQTQLEGLCEKSTPFLSRGKERDTCSPIVQFFLNCVCSALQSYWHKQPSLRQAKLQCIMLKLLCAEGMSKNTQHCFAYCLIFKLEYVQWAHQLFCSAAPLEHMFKHLSAFKSPTEVSLVWINSYNQDKCDMVWGNISYFFIDCLKGTFEDSKSARKMWLWLPPKLNPVMLHKLT